MGKDNKVILSILTITIAIIGVGAYLLTRGPKPQNPSNDKVNNEVLVRADSNKIQAKNEKVVLVEFGDFQCPACGTYFPLVKKLTEDYKDNLSFVFRNYPLQQHKNARIASYAAEASGKQGKYWEMFDKIYENQDKWSDANNAKDIFTDYAKSFELNIDKFQTDINSNEVKQKVDSDYSDGVTLGINSTPTFFLNGTKIQGPRSYKDFQTLVDAALLNNPVSTVSEEKYHAHFDLAVNLKGKAIDFSQTKYQESKDNALDPDIHFHDGNGKVVHIHKKGVTLGQFIKSLKMELSKECFSSDSGQKYCNDKSASLKLYVNGKLSSEFENYIPVDLDRILITFGSENEAQIKKQLDSVSNDSCIYSEKCPERGKPPTENCVGGLGTGCDEE